jgi:HlyD family secretion protein
MRWLIKIFFILLLIGSAIAGYDYLWSPEEEMEEIFTIETPETRSIVQSISASGELDIKDRIKVGSLANGIIKAIHVQENQEVKEGKLLAEINTGRGDTDLREAQGEYEKALAELEYEKGEYNRNLQLLQEKLISDIKFQESKKAYHLAQSNVKITKAIFDRRLQECQNCLVMAPTSGIITAINVMKGEYVAADGSASSLFHLAPDVTKMEVTCMIDERDIGQIQLGQKVTLVVDTYPNKIFESTIQNISFSPNGFGDDNEQACLYEAKAYLDNPHRLLRPGMHIHATIFVESVESALAITSRTLLIKKEHLESISELFDFEIHSLSKEEKHSLVMNQPDKNIQFVWKVFENQFIETPIEIGISDDIHFEVISGLNKTDELVLEIAENDTMQAFYDQAFKRGL